MWLETSKMDPGLTGSLLGGGLLGDVLHRMAAAKAAYQANSQVSSLPVCCAAFLYVCVSASTTRSGSAQLHKLQPLAAVAGRQSSP